MTERPEDESQVPDGPTADGADADWRLRGQEDYLSGASWVRRRYRAYSETWEHDHCEFCGAKLLDAEYSAEHRAFIETHRDVLAEGYATTSEHPMGADYYWVCDKCFADFAGRFGWRLVAGS